MAVQLDPLSLGLVLALIGIGGTLLTLFVFSLIIDALKRLFPVVVPTPDATASSAASASAGSASATTSSNPGARSSEPGSP